MRAKAKRFARWRGLPKRLYISAWQTDSWKKPFSTFEPVCGPKHFRNLQQTIDCMKNKTSPAPGNRLLQLALSSLAGYAFACSPQALGAVTNVSIVNFA